MLVVDSQIVKTTPLVSIASPEDDSFDSRLFAHSAVAVFPGLRLKSAANRRLIFRESGVIGGIALPLVPKEFSGIDGYRVHHFVFTGVLRVVFPKAA